MLAKFRNDIWCAISAMSAFFKFLSLLFFTALLIIMSSCGKEGSGDDPIPNEDIQLADFVGAWKLNDPDPLYLILNSDGTGSTIEFDDESVFEESVVWDYNNRYLTIFLPDGRVNMFVKKIAKSMMILTNDDEEYTYIRIKKTDIPNYEADDDNDDDNDDNGDVGNGNGGNDVVTTLSAEPRAFRAVLKGQYAGNKIPTKVGFEYSYDSKFPTNQTATVETEGKFGGFELEARGMVDQATVYYRAFVTVDEKTVYGKTKSLETPQGTYTIDGKTYKFIKVTGLATGSFSMMQTELPPYAVLEIDGEMVGQWDPNAKDPVTKGETRELFNKFGKAAVLPRYPTAQEWMWAAAGGSASKGFKYCGSNDIDEVAWYSENSHEHVRTPAIKKANELGFYDMSGNYAELCANYDDYELEEIRERYIKKFMGPVQNVSAAYFNTCWSAGCGAFGGNWSSSASKCQTNSSESYRTPAETNRFDGSKYTARLVYSRPD